MGILNIRKAKRHGARLVIGFLGQSGSGKTLTAIKFGLGLAGGNAEKLGFIDTENGRGSLYADKLVDNDGKVHEFYIGDLDAPFSPERYILAIEEFQAAGVEVLVIDSVSHEWSGLGGCTHIAETTGTPKMPNWIKAKREHKRFMHAMLSCDMHVIVCIRTDPKVEVSKGANGATVFIDKGLMPVQEKSFVYDLTASVQMMDEGKRQIVLKCPEDLRPFLGRQEGYIGPKDGYGVRKWVDGATIATSAATTALNTLRGQTEQGAKHIQAAWKKLPKDIQDALGQAAYDRLLSSAQAFDRQREDEDAARSGVSQGDDDADDLNAPVEPAPVQAKHPTRPPASQPAPAKPEPAAAEPAKPTLPPPVSRRAPAQTKPAPPSVEQIEAEIEGAFGDDATGPDGLPW